MESVIEKIREARNAEQMRQAESNITDTVIDGCQVRMRFDKLGSSNVLSLVQSMLISAHLDTTFAAPDGGQA